MTTTIHAGAGRLAALALLAGGCASISYAPMERPTGSTAFGLAFGDSREAVEASLRDAGIPFAVSPADPDALVAARCPRAPAATPCRLVFGPRGLYAAQIEAPSSDAGRLVSAAEGGLGKPTRQGDAESKSDGQPSLVAAWDGGGWTVGVSRLEPKDAGASAVLRVERDAVAPPVVAGVPLGRRRAEVEHALELQGAVVVQRDDEATTYLGCPGGDAAALTCVVSFVDDRAMSVTEVHPTPALDEEALDAWRALAARWTTEIGRQPATACPAAGPERATGDCTATWGTDRLVIVVGAHRNAGGDHRGVISVYTAWSYPTVTMTSARATQE